MTRTVPAADTRRTADAHWQQVERTYRCYLRDRWDPFLCSYPANGFMAVVHSIRAGMGHGDEEDCERARRCVDLIVSPPLWDAGNGAWRVAYPPSFGYHPSVDARYVEGLYYAWRYREEIGLSVCQIDRITDVLCRKAQSAFLREDWFNQENAYWHNNAIYAAYEVTGDNKYADYWIRYFEHFVEHIDKPSRAASGEGLSCYLWPDYAWNYNDRFYDTVEYGEMCYGGMINYQRMKDCGVYSLDEAGLARVQGYQQYALGMWQLDGYLNWDTGYGPERLLNGEYWAFALRGLTALACTRSLSSRPEDSSYARFIFDRAVELFGRMDTWKGDDQDGAAPLQPYGVGYAFGSKYELNVMFIANLCIALELGIDGVPALDPRALWRYNWYHRKLAVTTGSYSSGIVAQGRGNFGYGGPELTGLFDRLGQSLLTARPSHLPLAMTFCIPDDPPVHTHNVAVFGTQAGACFSAGEVSSEEPPRAPQPGPGEPKYSFHLTETPDGPLDDVQPYDTRCFTPVFDRISTRGTIETCNYRYEVRHTFLRDAVLIRRKLTVAGNPRPGRAFMTIPFSETIRQFTVVDRRGASYELGGIRDALRGGAKLSDLEYMDFRGDGTGLTVVPVRCVTGDSAGIWISHSDGDLYSGGPATILWLCLCGFSSEEVAPLIAFDCVMVTTDGSTSAARQAADRVRSEFCHDA